MTTFANATALASALLGAVATTAAVLTVQFPQYAVWFTLAGTLAAGLLRSPIFAGKAAVEKERAE